MRPIDAQCLYQKYIRVDVTGGFVLTFGLSGVKQCDSLCVTGDTYKGADKSLARPTSRCILFDGENISFDASLVIYI